MEIELISFSLYNKCPLKREYYAFNVIVNAIQLVRSKKDGSIDFFIIILGNTKCRWGMTSTHRDAMGMIMYIMCVYI